MSRTGNHGFGARTYFRVCVETSVIQNQIEIVVCYPYDAICIGGMYQKLLLKPKKTHDILSNYVLYHDVASG